jgi:regulator of protease activity HflC (stomatin/prohibitin superfamily)
MLILPTTLTGWVFLALLPIVVIWALCAIGRVYGVWAAHKRGQADLAQAQNDQQIQVARAQGRLQAAELNKQAEIIDASAVAKSVEIIGTALHNNHGYLQWKWIHMMEENDNSVIYVPTEAGLPILEAGRLQNLRKIVEEEADQEE